MERPSVLQFDLLVYEWHFKIHKVYLFHVFLLSKDSL